jgi:hypothetical protein
MPFLCWLCFTERAFVYGAQVKKSAKWIASRSKLGWAENDETLV